MALRLTPPVPLGEETGPAAIQQPPWRNRAQLSSFATAVDSFLGRQGLDRGPWIAVFFAAGIAFWFVTPSSDFWISGLFATAIAVVISWRQLATGAKSTNIAIAALSLAVAFFLGITVVWVKSVAVGEDPIAGPITGTFTARVLERIEQPAQDRVRLIVATREPETGRAIKLRVNVPMATDQPEAIEGAVIRLKARITPPGAPLLPGGYDFARAAWFQGLAGTGASYGEIEIVELADRHSLIGVAQRRLSAHVRERVDGQAGAIAAAFASGDRGAISQHNENIMRDSGLTHLLSISGVHVSAVIAAGYFASLKLLGLWPWLALRTRLPVVAAVIGAGVGVGYTLVAGMEVPTVRSCIAALLVLCALVIGREPLSMRMLSVAAICVLAVWPEALAGPSFQMSFAAVLAIIALHTSTPIRQFLAPREEAWIALIARRGTALFITGLVIELTLLPIVMFHFHRAGIYGSLANMIAIPLASFISLPAIGLGLLLDLVGLGAPLWWVAGQSLDFLIGIAEVTSSQRGAVKFMPQIGRGPFAIFVTAVLLTALLRNRARWIGLVLAAVALGLIVRTPAPDILITGDGRHVAIVDGSDRLYVLRDGQGSFAQDNLAETAGFGGVLRLIEEAPFAKCSPEFCVANVPAKGRDWTVLVSRNDGRVSLSSLNEACAQSDIVVASRRLPRGCKPRWFKADRRLLEQTGGLSLNLNTMTIETVAQWQGQHGWWQGQGPEQPKRYMLPN